MTKSAPLALIEAANDAIRALSTFRDALSRHVAEGMQEPALPAPEIAAAPEQAPAPPWDAPRPTRQAPRRSKPDVLEPAGSVADVAPIFGTDASTLAQAKRKAEAPAPKPDDGEPEFPLQWTEAREREMLDVLREEAVKGGGVYQRVADRLGRTKGAIAVRLNTMRKRGVDVPDLRHLAPSFHASPTPPATPEPATEPPAPATEPAADATAEPDDATPPAPPQRAAPHVRAPLPLGEPPARERKPEPVTAHMPVVRYDPPKKPEPTKPVLPPRAPSNEAKALAAAAATMRRPKLGRNERGKRPCLSCGRLFMSDHAGIRMCPPCRGRNTGSEII